MTVDFELLNANHERSKKAVMEAEACLRCLSTEVEVLQAQARRVWHLLNPITGLEGAARGALEEFHHPARRLRSEVEQLWADGGTAAEFLRLLKLWGYY